MAEQKKSNPLLKLDFTDKKQGFAAALLGILVALILAALSIPNLVQWLLALGVVVGILNIFHKEGVLFLISGLAITYMLSIVGGLTVFPPMAGALFNAVIYLLAPATIIVGLKVLYALATK